MNLVELGCALGSGCVIGLAPTVFRRQGPEPERQLGLQVAGSLLAAVGAAAVLVILRRSPGGWAFLALGAGAGLLSMVNAYTYLSMVLHRGPVSISWSIVYLTAVTVPALGWLLLKEPVLFWQPWGLLCILACLAVMAVAARRTAQKRGGELAPQQGYWFWLGVALAAGTVYGFLTKFKDTVPSRGDDFSFILTGYAAGAAGLFLLSRARGARGVYDRRTWLLASACAVIYIVAIGLLLRGLQTAAASALFPVQSGAAIIFGLVLARVGGERPSRLAYAGALLAIAAIVLVNLGGRQLTGG
ncbi:MAG TPA: EamA family transporter [Planctomycetota bacterium]|nr:EamA family transporter [Planctomycetota bacterium]